MAAQRAMNAYSRPQGSSCGGGLSSEFHHLSRLGGDDFLPLQQEAGQCTLSQGIYTPFITCKLFISKIMKSNE